MRAQIDNAWAHQLGAQVLRNGRNREDRNADGFSLLMVAVLFVGAAQAKFLHGIVIAYDNNSWYMAGPADGPNGEKDIPAHEWVQTGKDKLRGKHLNTGPFGASKWWSSDAPDGEYLYNVDGIIDVWTSSAAQDYANKGTYITTSSSRHPTA